MRNYLITYEVIFLDCQHYDPFTKEETIQARWEWQARRKFNNEPKHKFAGKAGERHEITRIQEIPSDWKLGDREPEPYWLLLYIMFFSLLVACVLAGWAASEAVRFIL